MACLSKPTVYCAANRNERVLIKIPSATQPKRHRVHLVRINEQQCAAGTVLLGIAGQIEWKFENWKIGRKFENWKIGRKFENWKTEWKIEKL